MAHRQSKMTLLKLLWLSVGVGPAVVAYGQSAPAAAAPNAAPPSTGRAEFDVTQVRRAANRLRMRELRA